MLGILRFLLSRKFNSNYNETEILNLKNTKKMEESKHIYILDNGHGGVIDGVYQTKGKRSPKFTDGTVLYEGEFNRKVVKRLIELLKENNIRYHELVPELEDIALGVRVFRANTIFATNSDAILISVHGNAFGRTWNNANGVEVFYFQKYNKYSEKGQKLAEMMQKHLVEHTGLRDRGAKGGNFMIIRETGCPAILTENGFMTNDKEAKLMLSDDFIDKVAKAHLAFILELEENGIE